jgi:phosphohistidine phosphatase SixA
MKKRVLIIAVAMVLAAQCASSAETGRVIILVRHAERASADPDSPLNDVGRRRAECLARTLADSKVQGIFTTELKRSQETADPLSKLLKIYPTVMKAADTDELVKHLRSAPEQTLLVVGHSDTLPKIIAGLGGGTISPIGHDEYDRMTTLTMLGTHNVVVTTLRFCPVGPVASEKH